MKGRETGRRGDRAISLPTSQEMRFHLGKSGISRIRLARTESHHRQVVDRSFTTYQRKEKYPIPPTAGGGCFNPNLPAQSSEIKVGNERSTTCWWWDLRRLSVLCM